MYGTTGFAVGRMEQRHHTRQLNEDPLSRPTSAAGHEGDGTDGFVASAILGGYNSPRRNFRPDDDDMAPFTMPKDYKNVSQKIKDTNQLKETLLNLGELVVEGANKAGLEDEATKEHGVFESFFDLTRARLKVIFDALDSASKNQNDGIADFKHLRRGLIDAGVRVEDEAAFARLVTEIDKDLDGGLTFEEFESVVQSLKMAYLLKSRTKEDIDHACHTKYLDDNGDVVETDFEVPCARVIDYGVGKILTRAPVGFESLIAFLYGTKPEWATTRWIDVTTPADFIVKALAIKYQLHPLALEDALHNEYDQGAKLDRYENHLFLIFPGMMLESQEDIPLTKREINSGRFWRKSQSKFDRLHRLTSSTANLDLSTPLLRKKSELDIHANDFLGDDKDDTLRLMNAFPGIRHFNTCMFLLTPRLDTLITIVESGAGGEAVFARARKELQVSYSRLRSSKESSFLTYTTLDVLVDGWSPVIDALERHIAALRIEVRVNANRREILFNAKSDSDFLARYHDVLHELTRAKRRLSPGIRVISNLTNSDVIDAECKIYLRDVQDHAEEYLERLEGLMEECRALKSEQQHSIDARLTKSMAALSIVSIVFLPGQFLSSVFGMNFRFMPLIDEENGYLVFWVTVIISWIGMYVIFRRYRVI